MFDGIYLFETFSKLKRRNRTIILRSLTLHVAFANETCKPCLSQDLLNNNPYVSSIAFRSIGVEKINALAFSREFDDLLIFVLIEQKTSLCLNMTASMCGSALEVDYIFLCLQRLWTGVVAKLYIN